MSSSASSRVISRVNQDIEGELDQEYGLFEELPPEVGATHAQVQDDQVANRNIYPSGLVTETQMDTDI